MDLQVSISPEIISKKVNRDIINELINLYRASHLGNRLAAYDGRKSIYTAGALPFSSKEFVIKLPDTDDQAGSSSTSKTKRQYICLISVLKKFWIIIYSYTGFLSLSFVVCLVLFLFLFFVFKQKGTRI